MEKLVFLGLIFAYFLTVSCDVIEKQEAAKHVAEPRWRTDPSAEPAIQIRIRKEITGKHLLRTETLPDIHYLADRIEMEGDDAHLYCKADVVTGKVKMSWKREVDTKPLLVGAQPFDGRIRVRKERHGVIELTITDLKPEDTGNYTCLVQLESGTIVRKTKMLIIEYKTRFSSRQLMLMKYHSLGGSTSITCQAGGHPVPTYRWYKDDRQLSDNSTFNIVNKEGKSTLKIKTKTDDDSQWVFGTYSCKAVNHHGTAVMQYKVQAAAIPDKAQNITIMTARSTYIELGVAQPGDTGGIPITGYRVRWMEEVTTSTTGGEGAAWAAGGGIDGEGAGGGLGAGGGAGGEGEAAGGLNHFVSSEVFNIGDPIVIPGLDPGKEYVFEIAALNAAGVGKTVFKTIKTPVADDDAAAVMYSDGSLGLYPLWVFLAILLFFILLIIIFLLLWYCGWLTSSALICSPCCAKFCPDCVRCCSSLCWCLPLLGCCVCCGRTHRGASYDVMRKKKIPLCICCPTEGLPIIVRKDNIRLLALQRNEKADVGLNSAFSSIAKVGAGAADLNATGGYGRGYHLQNDYKQKSDTMTSRRTDTMTSRRSDTTKNMVFSYETESSSSESGRGMNTIETQTNESYRSGSRDAARDHHVTREVFLQLGDKGNRYPEGPDSVLTYALASDWNQTKSRDRIERGYVDDVDISAPVLRRISKRDERYASQPMGEHLSRRDSVNRDRQRRSSVEVITFYQPGEPIPANRDAQIQIYTNEEDFGSLPRHKVAQFYQDTRVDHDRHLRSSSIPRNVKLSAVDMGDPTATDYTRGRDTYAEVRKRKDRSKYNTAPVVRREPRYMTDEGTQTWRRSKYDNEVDIPLEMVQPSREPTLQRHPSEQPEQPTEYSEVHTQGTLLMRSQKPVREVIYRPVTVETKETNTMTERPKRWSRPPTPPLAAPSDTIYRTFPIEMEQTPPKRKHGRRAPVKPQRSKPKKDVEDPVQRSERPKVESGRPFDFDALDRLDSANIQTQTEFSRPLDSDSITKERHGRWPEEAPTAERQPQSREEQWQEEAPPVRASPREPVQRGRWPNADQEQPLRATPHEPVQRGRWPGVEQPESVPQLLVPTLERGVPLYRPHPGQEVVEETVIRRHRSFEILENMDQSEAPHQYAVGPEVIFVDSGNYSMEVDQGPHHHSTRSDPEPVHHLEVSPPETHDFFEETEIIEATDFNEQEVTEVTKHESRTETKTQVTEIQSSQSAFQEYRASGTEYQTESGGTALGGGGYTQTRIGEEDGGSTLGAEGSGGGYTQTRVGEEGGGSTHGARGGGGGYTQTRFGEEGGWTTQGSSSTAMSRTGERSSGYTQQSKTSTSGGYSVQGPRTTEGRTYLNIERQSNRSSPSYDSRNVRDQRSYWRV